MQHNLSFILFISLIMSMIFGSLAGCTSATKPAIKVTSPYEDVDWESVNQYKSAFHVHIRTQFHSVRDVVRWHEEYGFDVFSLTEKNRHTTPVSTEMLVIPAFESTGDTEHRIGLFVDANRGFEYNDVEQANGVQWHAHPNDPGRDTMSTQEFVDVLEKYDSMIGFEIISRNNYPQPGDGDSIHDHRRGKGNHVRATSIWDDILTNYGMTEVYGVGVTDGYNDMTPEYRPDAQFFGESIYNTGWTTVLAKERKPDAIREAMLGGHMFWVSNMDVGEPPKVTDIQVDVSGIRVVVEGDYDEVKWIFNGETVQTGEIFDFGTLWEAQNYVRFEIWTRTDNYYSSDIVGSQPFVFVGKTQRTH